MTEDDRRERIHAVAEVIDSFVDEADRFVLIVFPDKPPEAGGRIQFDILSSHRDREYVATVLQHVVDGLDADLIQPAGDRKPN